MSLIRIGLKGCFSVNAHLKLTP
jgi:hypothetical protein